MQVGRGTVGIDLGGLAEVGQGFFIMFEIVQHETAVVVGLRQMRGQDRGLGEIDQGLIIVLQRALGLAPLFVGGRHLGVQTDGLAELVQGAAVL